MNVDIGTEAAQSPEKVYINGIFVAVYKACRWNLGGRADNQRGESRIFGP
jgi:hypothetical protein